MNGLRRQDLIWAGMCGLVAAFFALRPFSDVDYHWHLAVGRHVAENGWPPMKNLWSFTAPEHPFQPTSWLFGLVIHSLYSINKDAAVHIFIAAVMAFAMAVTYLTSRHLGAAIHWALGLNLVATVVSAFRFVPRPHTISYLFLSVTLHLLVLAWNGKRRALWGVPLLLSVWSNFHAGAVFGVGAVGCFVFSMCFLKWRKAEIPFSKRDLALISLASIGAIFLNPSGFGLLGYGVHHLQAIDNIVVLGEFMTPPFHRFLAFWAMLAVAGVLLLAAAFRDRKNVLGTALWASFALLAIRAIRVVPKFMLVTNPFVAAECTALEKRWPRFKLLFWVAPGAMLIATVLAAPEPLAYTLRPLGMGVEPTAHPEAMAQWVRDNGVKGRCFASWDVAGFVEHRLPESPVFIDPRIQSYPPSLFHDLEEADESQEKFDALMKSYQVEWAFRGHSVLRMSGLGRFAEKDWALVYWDETGQVMLNRNVERFQELIAQNEFVFFRPGQELLESFMKLSGEARTKWEQEVNRVARQSPKFISAQIGQCLILARARDGHGAAVHCKIAGELVFATEKRLPQPLLNSRRQLAAAFTYLGDLARRASHVADARRFYANAIEFDKDARGARVGMSRLGLDQASQK